MSVIIFTVIALVVAFGVWGVVAMGMAGKGKEKHPALAHRFARAAQALNGEGQVPERLEKLFR
ncbi:hypothetical protein [Granulicoccus sp. GXG6511]|uniref:hypothetical protein n=1 Tax=Granulicoccus sp. GXG6511 TaxID=3381351 RepID=UPI003D7ED591